MSYFSSNFYFQKYSVHNTTVAVGSVFVQFKCYSESRLSPGMKLVPFDVASLFTSVPVKCATELAHQRLYIILY